MNVGRVHLRSLATNRSWLWWLWIVALASFLGGLVGLVLVYTLYTDNWRGGLSNFFGAVYVNGAILLPAAVAATAIARLRIGRPTPLRRRISLLIALLAAVSLFPVATAIATCRCCLWTTGAKICSQSKLYAVPQGAYFYGDLWSFKAGQNDRTTDERTDYRWMRLRLGIPAQAITIDIGLDVAEWHMFFEDWFWVNLVLWSALWGLYQLAAAIYLTIRRRYEPGAL